MCDHDYLGGHGTTDSMRRVQALSSLNPHHGRLCLSSSPLSSLDASLAEPRPRLWLFFSFLFFFSFLSFCFSSFACGSRDKGTGAGEVTRIASRINGYTSRLSCEAVRRMTSPAAAKVPNTMPAPTLAMVFSSSIILMGFSRSFASCSCCCRLICGAEGRDAPIALPGPVIQLKRKANGLASCATRPYCEEGVAVESQPDFVL
jgi:hypothetical protein